MKFIHKNRNVLLLVAVFTLTAMTSGGRWGVYFLLLLCPAMHFLMHRGMQGSGNPPRNVPCKAADTRKRAIGRKTIGVIKIKVSK